jgi:uncharacterized protein YndB with AHSA1/START domain
MSDAAQKSGNSTVTTPSDREITVTRIFNAPRRLVFDAWTKPQLVKRWLLGPPGWSMPVCEIDLRIGGTYRFEWRNGDGREFGMGGIYSEVKAPKHYVATEKFNEDEAVVTNVFTEQGGKTMSTHTMLFATKEARDSALNSGMTKGMEASYVRLDAILAGHP